MGVLVKEIDKHKSEIHLLNDKLNFKETENQKIVKDLNIHKDLLSQIRLLYKEKIDEHEILKKIHQNSEVEIAGFKQIELEKDERIAELRASLQLLQQLYDEEQEAHVSTKVELENLIEVHSRMETDYIDTIEKYKITNNQRFLTEIDLKNKTDAYNELKESEKELEKLSEGFKKQIENDEIKMIDLKREVESRKMKANNITTQFNLKINHLNERIAKLTETINIERSSKEIINEKLDSEQKISSDLNVRLLKLQSILKDKELEINDLNTKIDVLEKTYSALTDQNCSTQELANKFRVSLENIERELNVTTEMLEKSEQNNYNLKEDIKRNTQYWKDQVKYEQNILLMEIEDYLTLTIKLDNVILNK